MDEPTRLVASTRLIALLTLGSRVMGLLREGVLGYYFGVSGLMSAFRIAFMVPNLARRLFGEGALSSAMIPVLSSSLQQQGVDASRRLVGTIVSMLIVVLVTVVVIVEAIVLVWHMFAPDPALKLAALLMPYTITICVVAVLSGVLNVRRHFAAPAAAPIVLNLGIIGGALAAALGLGLTGMSLMQAVCISILVAGLLQLVLVWGVLRRLNFSPIFGGGLRDPAVRRILVLMAPMVVGLSAVQVNSLADYLIAYLFIQSDLGRVGPAGLGFAQYLYQLPLGVFGIALATAIFPILSEHAAAGDRAALSHVFTEGLRLSLFIAIPACVGLVLVATPLVATLYQRGAFDAAATLRVSGTLVCYALGIVAYFSHHLLVRTFYALKDSRTPARLALWMVGVNLCMNLALVWRFEERGLALATALCATIQMAWLACKLRSRLPEIRWNIVGDGLWRMLLATTIMGGVLWTLDRSGILDTLAGTSSAIRLAILVPTGVVVYALVAHLLGLRELRLLLRSTRSPGTPDR